MSVLFSFVLVCTLAFFMLAQCASDTKGVLSWFGYGEEEEGGGGVAVRELDMGRQSDVRIATSLLTMLKAAGFNAQEARDVRVGVIASPEVNAFTFGDRTFFLFEGLGGVPDHVLDTIMAHEVAHAIHSHATESASRSGTIATVAAALGAIVVEEGGAEQAASWAVDLAMPSHSRDQELEADATGVAILSEAGYGDRAVSVALSALDWVRQRTGSDNAGFFASHPSLQERIDRLEKMR
tara:strand:+ start:1782 stop:2495 length:714 start_codon:yes stop_codon:yes gene_type:complete